jgi:hypothetical protein
VIVQNLVLIGQGVFSRRTLENRPFPLKAYIAYTTLLCSNALACDDVNSFQAHKSHICAYAVGRRYSMVAMVHRIFIVQSAE